MIRYPLALPCRNGALISHSPPSDQGPCQTVAILLSKSRAQRDDALAGGNKRMVHIIGWLYLTLFLAPLTLLISLGSRLSPLGPGARWSVHFSLQASKRNKDAGQTLYSFRLQRCSQLQLVLTSPNHPNTIRIRSMASSPETQSSTSSARLHNTGPATRRIWSREEDEALIAAVARYGSGRGYHSNWPRIAASVGNGRTRKVCLTPSSRRKFERAKVV